MINKKLIKIQKHGVTTLFIRRHMPEEVKDTEIIDNDIQNEEVLDGLQESVDSDLEQDTESSEVSNDSDVQLPSKPSKRELKEEIKQENLQALRESRKQLQKERDEYLLKIQALEAAQYKKPIEEDDEDEFEDSTTKELKQVKKYIAQMSVNNSKMKLQAQFPDFTKVVNDESITILKHRFPEIAATLDQSNDIYTTGVSAYNIIKKFGLHVDEDYANKREKVSNNIAKPRPVSSVKSQSDLNYASDYSDLKDKSVRDEIIRVATERAMG